MAPVPLILPAAALLLATPSIWDTDLLNRGCPTSESKAFCEGYFETYRAANPAEPLFQANYKGRTRAAGDMLNLYFSLSQTILRAEGVVPANADCAVRLLCGERADRRKGSIAAVRAKLALFETVLIQARGSLDSEDRGFYLTEAGGYAETVASLRRTAKSPEDNELADLLSRLQVELAAVGAVR